MDVMKLQSLKLTIREYLFGEQTHEIRFHADGTAEYNRSSDSEEHRTAFCRVLSPDKTAGLLAALGKTDIARWKRTYESRTLMDGTYWFVEIREEGKRKVTIKGNNAFPEKWDDFRRIFGLIE